MSVPQFFLIMAVVFIIGGAIFIASPYVAFGVWGDEMPEKVEAAVSLLLALGVVLVGAAILALFLSGFSAVLLAVAA